MKHWNPRVVGLALLLAVVGSTSLRLHRVGAAQLVRRLLIRREEA